MKNRNEFKVGAIINRLQKSNNGITLIALVLTIIVLLILAGVSLNLVAGSNGILNRTTNAASATKQAQLEEELQLALAEIMMDYYIEGNGKTLQEYIIEQCNKPENNGMLEVGNGTFSSIDGELYYTDSNGNISMITVDNNGNVSIEGSISADGTVNDTNPPSIFATATTSSISLVIKDPLSGIAGWAYSTTNVEPSEWNEVSDKPKSHNETITGLTNGTTYYIWAKDANGNKSQVKEVTTLEIGKNIIFSKPNWNGSIATYQVTGEQAGCHLEYKIGTTGNWEKIESNTVSAQSGETLFVCLTDGNNKGESVSTSPRATYYIKYNSNDGVGTMENSTHEHLTASKLAENTFTKDGYTFVGWSKNANGTKEFDNQAEITNLSNSNGEIVNLYAVWIESTLYLYNNGTINPLVGDFVRACDSTCANCTSSLNFTKEPTTLHLSKQSGWANGGFLNTKAIDVTHYKSLYFTYDTNSYFVPSTYEPSRQLSCYMGLNSRSPIGLDYEIDRCDGASVCLTSVGARLDLLPSYRVDICDVRGTFYVRFGTISSWLSGRCL